MAYVEVEQETLSRQPSVVDDGTVRVGDLVVDIHKHRIHGRTHYSTELTRIELGMLLRLVENAGRWVSRDRLATDQAVFDGQPELVDVFIRGLRRQIGKIETSATIESSGEFDYCLLP